MEYVAFYVSDNIVSVCNVIIAREATLNGLKCNMLGKYWYSIKRVNERHDIFISTYDVENNVIDLENKALYYPAGALKWKI